MASITLGVFSNGLHGKSGSTVFVQTADGTYVRDRIVPHDPRTASQLANRQRLARASRAWSEMEPEQVQAWESYAQSLATRNPATGQWRSPRPMNLFTTLYSKLLQLDSASLPPSPPATPFFGDVVAVSVDATDDGAIRFTANRANHEGIVTELLLQPLAAPNRRTYERAYRSRAIKAFTEESLTADVPAEPGWYACAFRFVNGETGQETPLVELGKIRVV